MTIYIALLRGINVGGHNKIKMAELRSEMTAAGFKRVQTYIQSGNILFEAEENDTEAIVRDRIERLIEEKFGIALSAVIRTAEEIRRIVADCPFSAETIAEAAATTDKEVQYAAMLTEEPPASGVDKLASANNGDDEYRIVGREVYLLYRHSVRDSKLSVNLQKLGVPATVRNWNTMQKLIELADGMEAE
ncbi:DUF1697 domain-containing protein [Paenibacillus sp. NEAU-GSW1]|uniref:DUF1697 domain-containing protein n=1 Tax=Paenibacillus sp. NEAU-GSW1 TaxID=2682486 RepID=UPI0012E2F04B|nr:DUF1697 domain-containing protein [Paenibacillus sp. NEAU-GSW1]MUT67488.1 DUF1697 domain-containing protein [Paenibacillus sp. NEAU-GSW1]